MAARRACPTSPTIRRCLDSTLFQASAASAASFFLGGLLPLLGLVAPTATGKLWLIVAVTLIGLAVAGVLGAWVAGTAVVRPALRVVLGGGLAMMVTALVGQLIQIGGI